MRVLSSSNKSLVRTVMFMSSLVVLTLSAGAVSVYAQTDMAEEQSMEKTMERLTASKRMGWSRILLRMHLVLKSGKEMRYTGYT